MLPSSFSASAKGVQAIALAGVLLFAGGRGWAQAPRQPEKPAGNDPFAKYHAGLRSTADRLLAMPLETSGNGVRRPAAAEEPAGRTEIRMTAAMRRVQQLRPLLEPILREEGLPPELAAVVLVESGGQASALSPKGARGLWQFMPETARRYGLAVTPLRDERLDVEKSTRAAARYLRDLHEQFGDWPLAFAAYNAGEDLVQRVIERKRTTDFGLLSSGSLPFETRRYVPAVVNAMQKFGNEIGLSPPPRNTRTAWILYAETKMVTNQAEFQRKTKGELK